MEQPVVDFNNIIALTFEQLRDKFVKGYNEDGLEYQQGFGMVATGLETNNYRQELANWLGKKTKNKDGTYTYGACYTDASYIKSYTVLLIPTTKLYFSSVPESKSEVKKKFLALANIVPQFDDKYFNDYIMYLDIFCAKRGMKLGPVMADYFINHVYNTNRYWKLGAVPTAVKFWEGLGFKKTGDKNDFEHDIMIWENKNTKSKRVKLTNNCYSCDMEDTRYKHLPTNLLFCSQECFYIWNRQSKNLI